MNFGASSAAVATQSLQDLPAAPAPKSKVIEGGPIQDPGSQDTSGSGMSGAAPVGVSSTGKDESPTSKSQSISASGLSGDASVGVSAADKDAKEMTAEDIGYLLEKQLGPEDAERLKHREKIPISPITYYACVARDVPPSERQQPGPKEALEKEWSRLRGIGEKGCWDEADPHEYDSIVAECKRHGREAHFGRIFEICVEKNSHLPLGDPSRKFKGRVVYQGNNVTDHWGMAAVFEELSSCPATMAASKA